MKFSLIQKQVFGGVLLVVISLLLANCGLNKSDSHGNAQPDCGFVQNVYGERISWKDSAAIPLFIHESFPAEMLPGLQRAMSRWDQVLGRPVFRIVQTGYQSAGPAQDGVNVVYWMKTWEDNKSTEQARTSVYWVGDQIKEADIRINNKNFSFYLDGSGQPGLVHLESLLVHELGHVLGLKHRDEAGSVMATYLASQTQRTAISAMDLKDVKCEY
jgi:hypothetical protein